MHYLDVQKTAVFEANPDVLYRNKLLFHFEHDGAETSDVLRSSLDKFLRQNYNFSLDTIMKTFKLMSDCSANKSLAHLPHKM